MLLAHFHSIRPPYETTQKQTLDWLVEAHAESEKTRGISGEELELFRSALREKLWRVGCKPDRIEKRGHILSDFLHREWEKMEIYRLHEVPSGKDLSFRSRLFSDWVDRVFEEYFPEGASPPDDLIHVSCTGYTSPSGAQKVVSKRGWGTHVTITHAYHMGCYGSVPAIRMGLGFLQLGKKRSDIVHTEVCSLHSNPSLHQTDQLVSQSLFADGCIKYSLLKKECEEPHFKILSFHEEIVAASLEAMTWEVAEWGFQMSLSKEIPVLIARSLKPYLERLFEKEDHSGRSLLKKALFAIHPGGPKILFHIRDLLDLSESQMAHSFQILKSFGNMSSATLPHIWEAILHDPTIPSKTPVVSLAFGPGLNIAGLILEKVCGS